MKSILLKTLLPLLGISVIANANLLTEGFDTQDSIDAWMGGPTWSETDGNPGGAIVVSNDVQPSNKNYTLDIPVTLDGPTDLTVKFEAKSLVNVAGVFHFYVEPEGFPQYFIQFNIEALIDDSTYTPLTFEVKDVPASATYVTLRCEMITGAVLGADVQVAIDNIEVLGPVVAPEGTWQGYDLIDDSWVNIEGPAGMLYVVEDPWIYSENLSGWFFLPEGDALPSSPDVWIHIPGFYP